MPNVLNTDAINVNVNH